MKGAKEPQSSDGEQAAMDKQREQAVGQMTLPIELGAQAASNHAPSAEVMPPGASTGAETPSNQRRRKWYSLYDKVCKKGTLYVDVIKSRQTLLTKSLDLAGG